MGVLHRGKHMWLGLCTGTSACGWVFVLCAGASASGWVSVLGQVPVGVFVYWGKRLWVCVLGQAPVGGFLYWRKRLWGAL